MRDWNLGLWMRIKYSICVSSFSFGGASCTTWLTISFRRILQLLDAIEDELLQGGYLIDWHACDLFPKSWIDLVVVLRCPSTSVHYDRLSTR